MVVPCPLSGDPAKNMENQHFHLVCLWWGFHPFGLHANWWILDRCARRTFECALSAEVSTSSAPHSSRAEKYTKLRQGKQNAWLVVRSSLCAPLPCVEDSRGRVGGGAQEGKACLVDDRTPSSRIASSAWRPACRLGNARTCFDVPLSRFTCVDFFKDLF